jgi:hypothetical protein
MRNRFAVTPWITAAVVLAVAAVLGLTLSAPALGEGSLCLTDDEAGEAMDMAVVTGVTANSVGGTECKYTGSPRKQAGAQVTLVSWVSRAGEKPALEATKESLCKLAKLLQTSDTLKGCAYAKSALKERDPVRLIRLLYALADKFGGAAPLHSIGHNPGYLWEPSLETKLTGSFAVFYETTVDRFVFVTCTRIYKARGADPVCAQEAARRLYAELTK